MKCHPATHKLQQMVMALFLYMTMSPSLAVDGVIEINQARALAGGVTPGDAPGFPVTIDQPGSYRLTSNLDVRQQTTPENLTVIKIEVDDVSIDLNGFSLLGATACDPNSFPCTPFGAGRGIDGEVKSRLSVVNGRVVGMGNDGVVLGPRSRIKELIAMENGGIGLRAGIGSTVTGCIAEENGSGGISTGQNSVLMGNNASRNGGDAGIFASSASTVVNNTAAFNSSDGIRTENDATVIGNTVFDNVNSGLSLSTNTGYVGNVVNENNGGNGFPQVSGGDEMGTNICGGDTSCP